MAEDNNLHNHNRHLPHWILTGSIYFITFKTIQNNKFTNAEMNIVYSHIITGNSKYYNLHSFIIMPDHVHILLSPIENISLSGIMKGIKGVSAYKINKYNNKNGSIWQNEYYDRIVRTDKEYNKLLNYILHNSIKQKLADDPFQYKWFYLQSDIQ